ncbi:MAG: T9SS type A sorting domain-containing protein [Bacteroidales bacterium]|nr:T9SS type A sorting domain-containing protein [Bacteroidales bacterium]
MKKMIISLLISVHAFVPLFSQELEPPTNLYLSEDGFGGGKPEISDFEIPETIIFADNFESYMANSQLACQNPENWTTWNNLPCTYEDPYIIDTLAFSGSKSVVIVDSNDLVKPIDNYTEGRYSISFKMYIPEGFYGYFNTLQKFNSPNSNFGMQVFFKENGNAQFVGQTATNFIYSYNNWFNNDIIIDLDNDYAKYFYNNLLIGEWEWSMGGGFSGINQLGGSNFFPWTDNGQGVAKFFIDDYQIEELESFQLLPPENLTLNEFNNNIVLNWDSPHQEYWIHYDGENYGNGIGPGPVYIAARFLPEDIQPLNGMYLIKIKFFARNSDCSYSLRVWTGENAGNLILEQDVPEFIPDSWNEIELNTPILIDASQELWLGNICSSINVWDYPAACDAGPALPYKGDLVSFDGINWASLSLEYGLDYNWNIRGLVTENTDNKENAANSEQHIISSLLQSNNLKLKDLSSNKLPDNPQNKNLTGYNIYHAFNWGQFDLLDFTTDTSYLHEAPLAGNYEYYVTALYNVGESIPSDTVSAFLTNINENEINNIRISPNPAKDLINIQSDKIIQRVTILNLSGKIIEGFKNVNKDNYTISLNLYKKGIYIIRLEIEGELIYRKIIVQ